MSLKTSPDSTIPELFEDTSIWGPVLPLKNEVFGFFYPMKFGLWGNGQIHHSNINTVLLLGRVGTPPGR